MHVLMIHNPSILYCEAANQVHEPLSTLFGDMLFQSKKAVLAGFWAINSSLCFGLHQSDRSFRTDKCCSLWLWCKSANWIWFSWTNPAMLSNLCSSLNYVLTGRLTPWHFFGTSLWLTQEARFMFGSLCSSKAESKDASIEEHACNQ
jgi:hypothetical protein